MKMDRVDKISLAKAYTGIFLITFVFLMGNSTITGWNTYFDVIFWWSFNIYGSIIIVIFIVVNKEKFKRISLKSWLYRREHDRLK